MVARRAEQVAAVRRVDVEENAGDHDRLLLEQLLEERLRSASAGPSRTARQNTGTHEAVVERGGEVVEVEPDVERRLRGHVDLEARSLEALQDVVALVLEVALQRHLLDCDALRVEQRDRGELQTIRSESAGE